MNVRIWTLILCQLKSLYDFYWWLRTIEIKYIGIQSEKQGDWKFYTEWDCMLDLFLSMMADKGVFYWYHLYCVSTNNKQRHPHPIWTRFTSYILIINLYCLFSLCSWRFHQLSTNMSHYGHYVLIDVVSRCNNSLENDLLIIHCGKQRNSQQSSDYLLQTSTSSKQWKQYKSTEDHTKVYFFAQEQKLTRSAKVNISQNTTLEHPLVFCKFSLLLNINNK